MSTLMRSHNDHHHHISRKKNHTFISYKTHDHDQMSLSRASDDMKEKSFIFMKKFKNNLLTFRCENLVKIETSEVKKWELSEKRWKNEQQMRI
jgi:hypothetical protein